MSDAQAADILTFSPELIVIALYVRLNSINILSKKNIKKNKMIKMNLMHFCTYI